MARSDAEPLSDDDLLAIPKVLLHDHFDGGLRPATVIELAREQGYRDLPTYDADDLAAWFHRGADRRSLELYLETFVHTLAVLRTPEGIERVAAECARDLAADGVVYAESRLAPEEITRLDPVGSARMTMDEVISAMARGFASAPPGIELRIIVCAMRNRNDSLAGAECAVRHAADGVVGFDIAGPEAGFPPAEHRAAFDLARSGGLGVTIHAGEAAGIGSIREALVDCGAMRLGHGVRIVDDIGFDDEGGPAALGPIASMVLERGVCLELCPTSNVHTGAAGVASFADHPIDLLARAGFAVTVNTDNRLMSDVTVLDEHRRLRDAFGWGAAELTAANETALAAAFCDDATRSRLRTTHFA